MRIKVAIAGVGNCASSLVQGVEHLSNVDSLEEIPGIMHPVFGGYHIKDIEFVAAFDVDKNKVGRDLSHAIYIEPNNTWEISSVKKKGVIVQKGQVLDGIGEYLSEIVEVDENQKPVDVAKALKDSEADLLISYLPVGSKKATEFYAEECLKSGCAMINAIPEFIASDPIWSKKFKDAGIPVAGDDIKSQVGATILHRTIVDMLVKRGAVIEESYQLNVGGNTDFLNMLESGRLKSKRISKTEAVSSLIPYKVPLRVGPSDYVQFLGDNKVCHIYISGKNGMHNAWNLLQAIYIA